jgi:hypothetical protein
VVVPGGTLVWDSPFLRTFTPATNASEPVPKHILKAAISDSVSSATSFRRSSYRNALLLAIGAVRTDFSFFSAPGEIPREFSQNLARRFANNLLRRQEPGVRDSRTALI